MNLQEVLSFHQKLLCQEEGIQYSIKNLDNPDALRGANLFRVNFTYARRVDLHWVDLSGADHRMVDISEATLDDAILKDTIF